MKDIEKFEKLVDDIEEYIPTIEYFPKVYRAKRVRVYIIFTESKEKYIGQSKNILRQIDIFMRDSTIKDILVVYIYETDSTDIKRLESKTRNINYDKKLTEL